MTFAPFGEESMGIVSMRSLQAVMHQDIHVAASHDDSGLRYPQILSAHVHLGRGCVRFQLSAAPDWHGHQAVSLARQHWSAETFVAGVQIHSGPDMHCTMTLRVCARNQALQQS